MPRAGRKYAAAYRILTRVGWARVRMRAESAPAAAAHMKVAVTAQNMPNGGCNGSSLQTNKQTNKQTNRRA